MLRITTACFQSATKLVLEGRLIGPWVEELKAALRTARMAPGQFLLNLSGVDFVDAQGLALLQQLRNEGVAYEQTSPFIQNLLGM
ncbi:MAG: hypothetical protein EXR86_06010 [Gammaproteobacteria bacterium]|nr:hypothetical protein [Gammaproteobacteria bacterium]